MKSISASDRDDCGPDCVDQAARLLEDERRRGGAVDLERVWARCRKGSSSASTSSIAFLAELVKADLRRRFDLGETPGVSEYLERFPELKGVERRLVSLIYEEFCLREEQGEAPDVASFCERYPDCKDSLASQLGYHRLLSRVMEKPAPRPRFPRPGEDFEEYHLVSLLGEGGSSRVFLARNLSLGGKQVVLKVSLDRGEEPMLQGRLDHPHIVPVNSVSFAPEQNLVGLSMPLQPGLPLDVIIARLDPGSRPAGAASIWRVLVDGASQGLIPSSGGAFGAMLRDEMSRVGPRGDRWAGFPIRGSYPRGAAWIVMVVARALHYAHSMATFHRDVKPGNVLLTLAHGPQLLDFNLAESPHSADRAHEAFRGGTLPYMAPEQIQAFLNRDQWGAVGAAADVYSLGLVLRELLTGKAPDAPASNLTPPRALSEMLDRRANLDVAVRGHNPTIPHALEAVVAKALAFDPADRYTDAESLAVDLERFLARKPLLHAVNTSRREKLVDWGLRRRRPLAASLALVLVLGVALRRPIADHFKPSLESLRSFQAAVAAVERGDHAAALRGFRGLEPIHPDSCLIKFYLAIEFDVQKQTYEAENRFRAALLAPDLETALVPWAKRHPDLALRLTEYTSDCFDLAFDDEQDDLAAQSLGPFYPMAREALLVAQSLNPDSPKIQRRLARVETLLGEYDQSISRLTSSIERQKKQASAPDDFDELFRARITRAWAATCRVDRGRGVIDRDQAFQLMAAADVDLAYCARFLENRHFDKEALIETCTLRNRIKAILSRVELEIDADRTDDAQRHLGRARGLLARFTEQVRFLDIPRRESDRLCKRLDDDVGKLRALSADASAPPQSARDQTGALSKSE